VKRGIVPPPGDVPRALDELGIEYEIKGDEAWAICPYHYDRAATSFSVNVRTGRNGCFNCGFGGGFSRIVEAVLDCSYEDAARWCRARILTGRKLYEDSELESKRLDTSKQINEASLALYGIPPEDDCLERNLSVEAVDEYGVLWDHDKDQWIIPIRDPYTNELWGWQEKSARTFRNRPRDIAKSETLFGLQSFNAMGCRQAILVESPLDVCRLFSAGITGGVSSYGVHVSDRQLQLITECADELVLALDLDTAGSRETVRLLKEFKRLPVKVFDYGSAEWGSDPGNLSELALWDGVEHATSSITTRIEY
jgi:DNA primase